MIKGLMGNQGVVVSGGNTVLPYVGQNPSNPMTGMVRVNGTEMVVFTGTNWQILSTSYATVSLDQDTRDLLEWARLERTKQRIKEESVKSNPALQKAYDSFKRAEENFDMLYKFVEHDHEEYSIGTGRP